MFFFYVCSNTNVKLSHMFVYCRLKINKAKLFNKKEIKFRNFKMENKCNKKSTYQQLQALAEYMEEHPDFARGSVVYGSSKVSTEEQWAHLSKKLNSMGPPVRTIVEWKKTWADLKCRTKKKIAGNNKSLRETGGGLYRMSNLTELEQIVDKTLSLTKSAAPSGGMFGYADGIISPLTDTPPRRSAVVAVITPTRQQPQKFFTSQTTLPNNSSDTQPNNTSATPTSNDWFLSTTEECTIIPQQPSQKRIYSETDEQLPGCSSAKKLKATNEQISLIRRQIRVSESSAASAREQAEATKILAETTKALVTAVTRMADAVEIQAESVKRNAETQIKILESIKAFRSELANYFPKK